MVTEVNAVTFRQNLGEMLNQVQYRKDSIVINRDGKPVAALVDAELFARIRRMRDLFGRGAGSQCGANHSPLGLVIGAADRLVLYPGNGLCPDVYPAERY